jgi:pilus assembly protein Flp/PilA
MKLLQKAKRFLADERGSNAIEYGLIATFIAVAIIGGVQLVGTDLALLFTNLAGSL